MVTIVARHRPVAPKESTTSPPRQYHVIILSNRPVCRSIQGRWHRRTGLGHLDVGPGLWRLASASASRATAGSKSAREIRSWPTRGSIALTPETGVDICRSVCVRGRLRPVDLGGGLLEESDLILREARIGELFQTPPPSSTPEEDEAAASLEEIVTLR